MQRSIRHSVITRLLGAILVIPLLFGAVTTVYSYYYAKSEVARMSTDMAHNLVQTVLPSVQIACFVNDDKLAQEVIKGLLSNDFIYKVSIENSTGQTLAEDIKDNHSDRIFSIEKRDIYSPFDTEEVVGTISVWLNQDRLDEQSKSLMLMSITPLLTQTLSISVALVLLTFFIFRPKSRQLMAQISSIKVDQGDTLSCPPSERYSEIGILIEYINKLISRMYLALSNERYLRSLQEKEHKRFQSIFDNAQTGIFLANRQGEVTSLNRACQQLGIYNDNSETRSQDFFNNLAPHNVKLRNQIALSFANLEEFTFEVSLPGPRGQANRWYQVNLTPIDKNSIQGIINDITTLKSESLIAYNMARTDSLTNLGNRMGLDDEVALRLQEARAGKHNLTVMMIDLDKFKQVNDTLGHNAGDEVLTHVAQRLRQATRDIDFIARHGGDEFVILLNDMEPSQSVLIASRLISSLNQKIVLKDGNITAVGASIGLAYVPRGCKIEVRELLQYADEAMYSIKKSGRNDYRLIDVSEASTQKNA